MGLSSSITGIPFMCQVTWTRRSEWFLQLKIIAALGLGGTCTPLSFNGGSEGSNLYICLSAVVDCDVDIVHVGYDR